MGSLSSSASIRLTLSFSRACVSFPHSSPCVIFTRVRVFSCDNQHFTYTRYVIPWSFDAGFWIARHVSVQPPPAQHSVLIPLMAVAASVVLSQTSVVHLSVEDTSVAMAVSGVLSTASLVQVIGSSLSVPSVVPAVSAAAPLGDSLLHLRRCRRRLLASK